MGNVGAVKHGRNTARRSASERGTVAPGSIDGSLSRGWCEHRRCFPLHPPRSRTWPSPARRYDLRTGQHPSKLRNTSVPIDVLADWCGGTAEDVTEQIVAGLDALTSVIDWYDDGAAPDTHGSGELDTDTQENPSTAHAYAWTAAALADSAERLRQRISVPALVLPPRYATLRGAALRSVPLMTAAATCVGVLVYVSPAPPSLAAPPSLLTPPAQALSPSMEPEEVVGPLLGTPRSGTVMRAPILVNEATTGQPAAPAGAAPTVVAQNGATRSAEDRTGVSTSATATLANTSTTTSSIGTSTTTPTASPAGTSGTGTATTGTTTNAPPVTSPPVTSSTTTSLSEPTSVSESTTSITEPTTISETTTSLLESATSAPEAPTTTLAPEITNVVFVDTVAPQIGPTEPVTTDSTSPTETNVPSDVVTTTTSASPPDTVDGARITDPSA